MRVLVIGAYGLIGSHVTARLLAEGHQPIGVGRAIVAARRRMPDVEWVQADLGTTTEAAWMALLDGASAVVNCAGALQDSPRDDLRAVHVAGVQRLLAACAGTGVRLIHMSAAGVAAGRGGGFNDTKLEAEELIRVSAVDWLILRPGLVLAPAAYGGTALLRGLAGLPFLTPRVQPAGRVQVVSVEDVATAVLHGLAPDGPLRLTVDLLHTDRLTLDEILRELRRWLGFRPVSVLPVPAALIGWTAKVSDALAWLGWRSPMRSTTLHQLRAGIEGNAGDGPRLLGITPAGLRQILNGWPSSVQERWFARAYFVKPLLLAGLSLFWWLSGLIGLLRVEPAAALLTDVGISPGMAKVAVVGGALLDMTLAVGIAFRRTALRALQGTLLVSASYAGCGTLLRPDLWADPLGPLVKIIPVALAGLAALVLLDER